MKTESGVRLQNTQGSAQGTTGKLTELEHKIGTHDEQSRMIFDAIRQFMMGGGEGRLVLERLNRLRPGTSGTFETSGIGVLPITT